MSDARIIDRGYRVYDGVRRGPRGATQSLIKHTAQRVLGLRRPTRAKILPILTAAIAYVPAIVFVGVAALVNDTQVRTNVLPTYGAYYGFIASALVIFATFVAPEALCPDRRTGLFGLYLASPLTRDTYLIAKAAAVSGLLAIATLGPPVLLLVANVLQGIGPDGPGEVALLAIRVLAAGSVIALYYTALSLAVASMTDRRAVASAGILLLLLVTAAVSGTLVEGVGLPDWVYVFNLNVIPFELAFRIYGEPGNLPQLSTAALAVAVPAWTVAGAIVVWTRYRRLRVVR